MPDVNSSFSVEAITTDIDERFSHHVNSMCATDDEVSIAWLLSHIDKLTQKHEAELKARNETCAAIFSRLWEKANTDCLIVRKEVYIKAILNAGDV